MNQNELAHHGIKGQKWGVRRTPEQLGYKVTDSTKKQFKALSDNISAKKARKKEIKNSRKPINAKKLTDAELQQRIRRYQNERTYNELIGKGPKNNNNISAGRRAINKIVSRTIDDLGGQTAKFYGTKLLNEVIFKNDAPIKDKGKKFDVNSLSDNDIERLKERLSQSDDEGSILDMSLDEVNDYLEHRAFKYISRKRVNGRWVYEYASDSMTNTPTNGDPRLEKSQSGYITIKNYKTSSSTNDKKLIKSQTGNIHVTPTGKAVGKAVSSVAKAGYNELKKRHEINKALNELGITKKQYKEYKAEKAKQERAKKYLKKLNMSLDDYQTYFK